MKNTNFKQDLFRKLSSRKFWSSIISAVSFALIAFNVADTTATQITTIIGSISSIIIYILSEAWIDGKKLNITDNETNLNQQNERND